MLAPWCEAESTEKLILDLGLESLQFWTKTVPVARQNGSLVVAPARDRPELARFARRSRLGSSRSMPRKSRRSNPISKGVSTRPCFSPPKPISIRARRMAGLAARLAAFDNVTLRFGVDAAQAA